MGKKLISLVLCAFFAVFSLTNTFADDATNADLRTISGSISLPAGVTAPAGGLNVMVMAPCFNGTPDNTQDDKRYGAGIMIPEGQSLGQYTLSVPESDIEGGCLVYFSANGYITTYYNAQGGAKNSNGADIISLKDGNKDNVNVTLIKGRIISGIVSLPDGEIASAGSVGVGIMADSDNGTPSDWQDDIHVFNHVDIPVGQNQAAYSITVPDSNSEYTLNYQAEGYSNERYSANGSCFIDVRAGDQTNINLTISHGRLISGIINLPAGATAPSGGLAVTINSYCDNGTPDNQADDLRGNAMANIPEGQSQAVYSVRVPDTDKGYTVYAGADGYTPIQYESQGNRFVYVSNGNAEGINMVFTATKTISGTISLPNNEKAPAGGLYVMFMAQCFNGTPDNPQDDKCYAASTMIQGGQSFVQYTLSLPESDIKGGCKVDFRAAGYITTYYNAQGGAKNSNGADIISLEDGNKDNVNVTLIKGRVISGIVSLPDGEIASAGSVGVNITANSDNGTPDDWQDDMLEFTCVDIPVGQNQAAYSILVPDSNSAYTLDYNATGYCSGRYSANGSYFIDVRAGDQTNINLTISRGKIISGIISLPVGVTAPSGGLTASIESFCNNGTRDNRTDDLRGYTTVNIPEGQSQAAYSMRVPDTDKGYTVYASANGYSPTQYESLVYVSNGNVEGINMVFPTTKTISGTISLPNNEKAPAGGLIVMVDAWFDNGTPENRQDDKGYGTDVMIQGGQSSGQYTLSFPESDIEGGCKVDFRATGYITTYYNAQGGAKNSKGADIISIKEGNKDNVNVTLIKGRVISGIVSLPDRETASAGSVRVDITANSDNGTPGDGQDDMYGYTCVDIPVGQNQAAYSIIVPDSDSAYTLDYGAAGYCSGRYSANGSCFIDVREGDQTNINITISHGKVISGIISLPAGVTAPSGGLTVSIDSFCNNGTPDNQTDDLRGYAIANIPEGQSKAVYSLMVPDTDKGYTVYASATGYSTIHYESQGNCFVYVSNGNAEGINMAFQTTQTISGTISLPAGETAPTGGLAIDLDVYSENGTPDNRQDDLSLRFNAMIPEGQNQTGYIIMVPASNSGYTLHFGTQGYCWGAYHEGSNYLIDLNSGDKTNVDLSFIHGKTISGVVSLPDGITAPAGGVSVRIESSSDNGTPGTWLDDMGNVANVIIPEGQKQAIYSMEVPESVTGFKMIFNASGYMTTYYTQQGGTTNYGQAGLVDLSDGSKTGINISLETGNALNVTAVNGTITKNSDKAVYIDGEKVTLTAVPNDGYKFVGWNGDAAGNEPVITVTMDGNKNITALFSKIITKTIVKLQIPKVQKDLNLKPGDQIKIDLSAIFSDGSIEKIENAKWETSNMEVATADNGVISAVGFGKAKVTASFSGKKVTLDIDTRLKSLKFEGKGEIKSSPGKSYKPVLKAVFADGTVKDVTNDSLTKWDSSNDAIAKVSDGIVHNQDKPGVAVITAKFGDRSSKFKIDTGVKKLVVSAKGTIKLQHRGNQVVINVTAVFEDGTEQDVTNNPLTLWSSSNSNIASVKKGIVLPGDKSGPAVITAVYGDKSIKVNVSVK